MFKDIIKDHSGRYIGSGTRFGTGDQKYPLRKAVVHHGKDRIKAPHRWQV